MSEHEGVLSRVERTETDLMVAGSRTDGSIEARVIAGISPTLYVAGHAVHHYRDGKAKLSELGTGSLALEAARATGASAFAAAAPALEDVNYEAPRGRALLDHLISMLPTGPRLVIDLHGMRARSDGIQVLIGVGRDDVDREALRFAVQAARAAGLVIHFDREGPYAARGEERLAAYLAPSGVTLLQIELAPELRDHRQAPDLYLIALSFLVELAEWPLLVAEAANPEPEVSPDSPTESPPLEPEVSTPADEGAVAPTVEAASPSEEAPIPAAQVAPAPVALAAPASPIEEGSDHPHDGYSYTGCNCSDCTAIRASSARIVPESPTPPVPAPATPSEETLAAIVSTAPVTSELPTLPMEAPAAPAVPEATASSEEAEPVRSPDEPDEEDINWEEDLATYSAAHPIVEEAPAPPAPRPAGPPIPFPTPQPARPITLPKITRRD